MIMQNALPQYVIEAGDLWSLRKVYATYLNRQSAELYSAACFLVYHSCKDKTFLQWQFSIRKLFVFSLNSEVLPNFSDDTVQHHPVVWCVGIIICVTMSCISWRYYCKVYGWTVILVSHLRLHEIFSISPPPKRYFWKVVKYLCKWLQIICVNWPR